MHMHARDMLHAHEHDTCACTCVHVHVRPSPFEALGAEMLLGPVLIPQSEMRRE